MSVGYAVAELSRNLRRHPGTSLGSFLSLMLLFLLFDLFWIASGTSQKFYEDLVSEVRMEAFVVETFADSVIPDLQVRVLETPGVTGAETIDRDQARRELARLVGTDLLVGYDSANPLPRSLVIQIDPDFLNTQAIAGIELEIANLPEVEEVHYSRQWLAKAEQARSLVLNIGLVLGLLILLTAVISSANSMRMMTRVRAVGLEQMRLLGASRMLLAAPFLLESLLLSLLAAALGWAAILYGQHRISFTELQLVIPGYSQIAIYVGICGLLGLVSGYFGIRRMLR